MARTAPRRSSIRPRSAGPTTTGAALARGRSSTSCTSARSPRGDAGGGRRELTSWRPRRHVRRADAGGEFAGGSAGATTASISSRRPGSTASPRISAALSTRRTRRPRRDPRRGLQPLRSRRQLPRRSPTDYFTDRHKTSGATLINFDGDDSAAVREFFSRTRATGSTSTTSTACGSTRRRASSTTRATTSWPRSRATCARRPGARTLLVAENEPQGRRYAAGRAGGFGLDAPLER